MFDYVSNGRAAYRCPSLVEAPLGARWGSNGKYDCTLVGGWSGARLDLMPVALYRAARQNDIENGAPKLEAIPFFVEEDPAYNLNSFAFAGSFAYSDRLATQHDGSGNFAATDGSAHRMPRDFKACTGDELRAFPLGGRNKDTAFRIGRDPPSWGWWNTR
jgi:hypothetical protein